MDIKRELHELSRNRHLSTVELQFSNDYYGHATILKQYAKYPSDYQIKAVIEHGVYVTEDFWSYEINAPLTALFIPSPYRYSFLKTKTDKTLFSIGPIIYYASHFLDERNLTIERQRLGRNLLVFPAHSTHWINNNYDINKYCQFIKEFGKDFNTISICLYWKDILMGTDEIYSSHGFECVTAGHIYDPLFLSRLKSIIELSSFTVSNQFGTHIGYCILMGKPHYLSEMEFTLTSDIEDEEYLKECVLPGDEIGKVFGEFHRDITSYQKEIVDKYWGLSQIKTMEEMRELFEITEKIYIEGNFSVYHKPDLKKPDLKSRLKKQLKEVLPDIAIHNLKLLSNRNYRFVENELARISEIPRYTESITRILDKPMKFINSDSFVFMFKEIFKKEVCKFKSQTSTPYILDLGADIGLSIVYFKKIYPESEIIAFETDKKRFEALSFNIKSFELTNVELINKGLGSKESIFDVTEDDKSFIISLKEYLNKTVDFLRLDIDGAEIILKECKESLNQVKNIFIRYHSFINKPQELDDILKMLAESGFRYYIQQNAVDVSQPFYYRDNYCEMDLQLNIYAYRMLPYMERK